MSYLYMASKPPGQLIKTTRSLSFDQCVLKIMDETGKSWEQLKDKGYTVDRYDETPRRSPLGSKHE